MVYIQTKLQLLAPVVKGRKGEHAKVFENARRSGYVRVRIDGNMYELSEDIKLEKNIKHNIDIIVDRLIIKPDIQQRLTDSVETASAQSGGLGAELAASITERCFDFLEHAPVRVTGFDIPYPPARLEKHHLPDLDRILDGVDRVMRRPNSLAPSAVLEGAGR